MDDNRSTPQAAMLGPLRVPAAILLLLVLLYSVISAFQPDMLPYMSVLGWLWYLADFALIVLLFVGRRNLGILMLLAFRLLQSLWGLAVSFGIYTVLQAAGWASLCLIAAATMIPRLTLGKSVLTGLAYLSAVLALAKLALFEAELTGSAIRFLLNYGNLSDWLSFSLVFIPGFVIGLTRVLGILFLAKALADTSSEDAAAPIHSDVPVYSISSPPAYSRQLMQDPSAPTAGQADEREP